jgi:hypothetical protein
MSRSDLSETQALAGDVCQYLFDEWCGDYGDLRFGGEKFRRASLEDAIELGYGEDDDDGTMLLIIRDSDGKAFEVELEANVYEVKPKAERDAQAKALLERHKAAGGAS